MKRRFLIVIGITVAVLTGCSQNTMSEVKSGGTVTTIPKPTLQVDVKVDGRHATVYVKTSLHLSAEHVDMERKDGEGHMHLYVDEGDKIVLTKDTYQILDEQLTPGKHTVKVSLHNNDHTPYDVTQQVDFVIE